MRATDFEYRHQTLIHLLIVAVCFLTYFLDRDDNVLRMWPLLFGAHAGLLIHSSTRIAFTLAMGYSPHRG